jgi:hypothetical protein
MNHVADNWYFGWGWLLWLCFVFLMFSSIGNWGYTVVEPAFQARQRPPE